MTDHPLLENGRAGRLCTLRLKPNEDLVTALERLCAEAGIEAAILRAGVGSLNDAHFDCGDGQVTVEGPGLEIVTLTGEIAPDAAGRPRATLSGSVSDREGAVHGGRFRRGENAICITLEAILQEWLPEPEA